MRYGKLSSDELELNILSKLHHLRKEVLLSAALGEDCAALKTDGSVFLISTDPITAQMPLEALGSLAVDVACNDIVANGGEPVALMFTLIMPENSTAEDIGIVMDSAVKRASQINVDIIGGHTEFSDCVVRPIVSATAVGKTNRIISKRGLKSGDKVYMTKSAAIEGSVILSKFSKSGFSSDELAELKAFEKLLSVTKEGKILAKFENISTMHDITEGGILGSVAEICQNVKLGARIYEKKIPVSGLTKKICEEFNADPYRLISSGSLMFTGQNLDDAVATLQQAGINAFEIGEITADGKILFCRSGGEKQKIKIEADQLFKVLKEVNDSKCSV